MKTMWIKAETEEIEINLNFPKGQTYPQEVPRN
jgi:hypothetical protein